MNRKTCLFILFGGRNELVLCRSGLAVGLPRTGNITTQNVNITDPIGSVMLMI